MTTTALPPQALPPPATPTQTQADTAQALPLERLEARICAGAANLTAAEGAWLLDVAEFDRREGWAAWGMVSCAAWLAWQVGMNLRIAREKVRVAHSLVEYPAFATAMADGSLTYSKARAITRIADEHNTADLLDFALASTSNQLERFVGAYHRVASDEQDQERVAHDTRCVRVSTRNGVTEIIIRVPVEAGAVFVGAIDMFVAAQQGDECTPSQRRADAAVDLAEHAVATLGQEHSNQPRYLASVHLTPDGINDNDEADNDEADNDEHRGERERMSAYRSGVTDRPRLMCCVAAGDDSAHAAANVPTSSARRMLCDAALEAIEYGRDGNPLRAGRASRTARRQLRRALELRDGGCRYPGCTHRGWLDAHHIVHWLDRGNTDIDNTVMLCRHHHRLVHEVGWTLTGNPGGELAFHRPDGALIPETAALPPGAAEAVWAHDLADTGGRCPWTGEPLDLHYAISVLFDREELRQHRAASDGG